MKQTLLYNALIINERRRYKGYVLIKGDKIARTGEGEAPAALADGADEAVDLNGAMLMPGVIDTHVHFRDPGLTEKGDMATESAAAAAGGVTSFIDMPNTRPATVTAEDLEWKMNHAAEVSVINYGFFIGATNDNFPVLEATDFTRVAGVKVFMGSSTGNMLVDSDSTLERVFRDIKAIVAVHAEDEATINRCREALKAELGGEVPVDRHPDVRPREACLTASRKAVEMARRYGTRLHLCHVSTADELSLLEPGDPARKNITAETCPHYLFFDRNDYDRLGALIKCNPAIKDAADRIALVKACEHGLIDTIATDHAPHLIESKKGDALTAASGMPGVEFSLPLMLELADENPDLTEERIVELMCHNPATVFGIDRRGFIREGYYADLTVVAPCAVRITDESVHSRCGWTPLAGVTLRRRPVMTMVNGVTVYSGQPTGDRAPMALRYNR